jgi:hypothetical protein
MEGVPEKSDERKPSMRCFRILLLGVFIMPVIQRPMAEPLHTEVPRDTSAAGRMF